MVWVWWSGVWRFCALAFFLVFNAVAPAQTNSWINPNSGRWDDTNSWSLGILPNSSQTVLVTNNGIETITIDATTAQIHPASLNIFSLTVTASNTLVLDQLGANALKVLEQGYGCFSVTGGGRVVNNSSGLTTAGLLAIYDDGVVTQNGGFYNGFVELHGGAAYNVTNATLTGSAELVFNCVCNEVNCAANMTGVQMYGGTYNLIGGSLKTGSINMSAQQDGVAFLQQGATNRVAGLVSLSGPGGSWPYGGVQYTMEQGLLCADSLSVNSGNNGYGQAWFTQNGGLVIITNSLVVDGGENSDHFSSFPVSGGYSVHNGTVYVGSIAIGSEYGGFDQDPGCRTLVSGDIQLTGGFGSPGYLGIGGGTLSCNNVTGDGAVEISQSAGTFTVSNLFRLAGTYTTYPCYYCVEHGISRYDFSGGTLFASNIEVDAKMALGSSAQTHRITNSGYFKLAGIIDVGDANESLGRFILASNTITTNVLINFTGTNTILSFATSSQETWSNSVTLLVSNWDGSFGGGGNEQLKFGTSASGLTAAQLNQIFFVNPVRLPVGIYSARILSTGEIVPATGSINYWIKNATGAWQETNSWSLHALPSASQSIVITGSWLNVMINPDTKNNFPQTLTVGDVTVGGSATTFMLNFISENIPFHALNGLTVAGESPTNRNSFLCLQSGAYVDGGGLYVTNGEVRQDGGFIHVTNADAWLNNGEYYITNGLFDVGTLWMGSSPTNVYDTGTASFFQYGGTVTASNIYDGSRGSNKIYNIYGGELDAGSIAIGAITGAAFHQYGGRVNAGSVSIADHSYGSMYTMEDGELFTSALGISGEYGGSQFTQNGGTVQVGSLTAGAITGANTGSGYVLNAGTLHSGSAYLLGSGIGFVLQNGGAHSVSGTLSINGTWDFHVALLGLYRMTAGTLTASNLDLSGGEIGLTNDASASFADVVVSGETGVDVDSAHGFIDLFGGTFSCGNFHHTGLGGAQIVQNGGSMVVSNLLEFGGRGGGYYTAPLSYSLNRGTLSASNIEVTANLIVRSTNTPAVINPGYFKLGGMLAVGAADVQFGRFMLESNAVINFTGGETRLGFADSHAQSWAGGMFLAVSNWNGSLAGGGAHQLMFGTNAAGLTAGQVKLIGFVNPPGFPAGTYAARILSTGEVVPSAPMVSSMRSSKGMVIGWSDNSYALQAATNVSGPWTNVVGATSPYTNSFAGGPEGFFRLVR